MNIEIKWNVVELRVRPQLATIQNVVTDVIWTCTATDADSPDYTHVIRGETILGLPDSSTFTSYEAIDELTVVGWLHSTIGSDKVKATELEAKVRCLDMRYPSVQLVVPSWSV